jgi:hypothetical protein
VLSVCEREWVRERILSVCVCVCKSGRAYVDVVRVGKRERMLSVCVGVWVSG